MDWTREDDYKRRTNSLVYMNNETTKDTEDTFSQGPSAIWFSIFVTEFIVIFIINSHHIRKKPSHTQAHYVPDNKLDCG